jgi:hypothetical protein
MSTMASCAVVLPVVAVLLALKARIPARPDTRYRCTLLWCLDGFSDDPPFLAASARDTGAHETYVH